MGISIQKKSKKEFSESHNEDTMKFCGNCGNKLPDPTKTCPSCKSEWPMNQKFCGNCGYNFSAEKTDNKGFSMGSDNVIAGDVIGSKDDYHIAGSATFITHSDETKKTDKCFSCGSIIQRIEGYECPCCSHFVCSDCFDTNEKICIKCFTKKKTELHIQDLKILEQKIINNSAEVTIADMLEIESIFHNSDIQYKLFEYYTDTDDQEAFKWLQLSVEQDNANAQYVMAKYYYNGVYVVENMDKCVELLQKAIIQNHIEAKLRLGIFLCDGEGIERDINKGLAYIKEAADEGNSDAMLILAGYYCEGEIIEEDFETGFHYLVLSADQGNSKAQSALGKYYHDGDGIEQDFEKAVYYLQKASDNGHDEAQSLLGEMYFLGEGIREDNEKALKYFNAACEKNNAKAQFYLGQMYYLGKGVEKDYEQAFRLFKLSAEQGDSDAQYY